MASQTGSVPAAPAAQPSDMTTTGNQQASAAPRRRKTCNWCSAGVGVLVLLYIVHTSYFIWSMSDPSVDATELAAAKAAGQRIIVPQWPIGTLYNMQVALSAGNPDTITQGLTIASAGPFAYGEPATLSVAADLQSGQPIRFGSSASQVAAHADTLARQITRELSKAQPRVNLHIVLRPVNESLNRIYAVTNAIKLSKHVASTNLLTQSSSGTSAPVATDAPHWVSHVNVQLVVDSQEYIQTQIPAPVISHLRWRSRGPVSLYVPSVEANFMGVPKTALKHVNRTDDTALDLPLEIEILPCSPRKFWILQAFRQSVSQLQPLGFPEEDLEEVLLILQENSMWLLTLTFVVSTVHLALDVLALRSDLQFWSKLRSTRGLSRTTLLLQSVSQVIITAYLFDQDASWLVVGPAVANVALDMWKLAKFWKLDQSSLTPAEALSKQIDQQASRTMMILLAPLVVGYSMYSLWHTPHSSWYSWALKTAVTATYANGFIGMTPQLFLNYRLRSVSHLPWNMLVYRAMNTFIDDLFAFIIRMPTLARLSCLRDDVIFIAYLYQRWAYGVDRSRSFDHED